MALTDRGANYRVFDKKFSDVVIGYIDYLPANTKEPYLYEMFRKQFGAKFIKKMKRGEMVKIPSDHSEMYMIWMSIPKKELDSVIGYIDNLAAKIKVIYGAEEQEKYKTEVTLMQILLLDKEIISKTVASCKESPLGYENALSEWSKEYIEKHFPEWM